MACADHAGATQGRGTSSDYRCFRRRRHGRGGRGHQGTCFSLVLAGGGLKHCGAYGVTDELSKKILEAPVSIPDFHATLHAALSVHPHKELFDGSRPVPITDFGNPVAALFV